MTENAHTTGPLDGKVALVAGATRGAGRAVAVELARAGAYVYATGRSSRAQGPSDQERPEVIEETGEMMAAAGGTGTAIRVDHLEEPEVVALAARIESDHGRLDVLVNDIFGGGKFTQWQRKVWEHDLAPGLHMLRMGLHTHLINIRHLVPLMLKHPGGLVVEMTDGTSEYNSDFRRDVGFYYDLVKAGVERITKGLAAECAIAGEDCTAVAVTPGWLRSESMLEGFGVTEDNWRDACAKVPGFDISESPTYVGRGIAALVADPNRHAFAGRVVSSGQLARLYDLTDVDGSRPDCWLQHAEQGLFGNERVAAGYR